MDNYKLLVVDDAFFIRNLIKKAVSNKPNTNNINISIIGEAKNANEAITFCETECPDIVTVDYLMPPGENGIELIKQLKEKYPNIMILMISDTTEIESNAIDLGCQFLVKPFKEEMIWKKLDNLILTKEKSNKIDSIIQEKNIVEKNEDSVVEDKTEFLEIVKPKKRKRKKKDILDLGFEVAGSLDSIQIDTTIKPNINTEIIKETEEEKNQVQNVKKDDKKEISEVKEEVCSPIEQETETVDDDDFDFEFEEIDDEIDDEKDSDINLSFNKDTQIKEIDNKEDEDDEEFEFEFDDEEDDEDEEEIIENDKSNKTVDSVDESDVVEEELEFDEDDFEEESETESVINSSSNKTTDKKDDSCLVDESDDVFTFYEEDESEYEDKDIDKFKEDGVVKKDIVEETEDRTDDDEIADLIKEASYSLDEDSKVIPEKSTNSTLNLLENDDDVFVSVDLSNSEEKKKNDIDTSDFDTMLDNFETSEEFKITQDEIKHEEAFDEQLNSLDNFDFSLDDLEDTTIDLTTEDDYEESKSENEKETLRSDDLTDNADDLNLDIDIDEAEDIDFGESEDLDDLNLDNENDLFMNYDESDMNLFDEEDDLFDDEFSSKLESNSIDTSETISNKKDNYEKAFDLDSDDLLFEDENDEFDLDQTYKLNNNKEDNYNIEHNDETMKEETIDSLIDDAYEDSDIIPIFDTQEMSTSEIIKQNQRMRRKKNLQKDEMMYKKNASKNHRPDGTKVKQKDSFFSRFFKEK